MNAAQIKYRISTSDTLQAFPIGVEQVLPGDLFSVNDVRKKASALKAQKGFVFHVSQVKGMRDIYVTRVK